MEGKRKTDKILYQKLDSTAADVEDGPRLHKLKKLKEKKKKKRHGDIASVDIASEDVDVEATEIMKSGLAEVDAVAKKRTSNGVASKTIPSIDVIKKSEDIRTSSMNFMFSSDVNAGSKKKKKHRNKKKLSENSAEYDNSECAKNRRYKDDRLSEEKQGNRTEKKEVKSTASDQEEVVRGEEANSSNKDVGEKKKRKRNKDKLKTTNTWSLGSRDDDQDKSCDLSGEKEGSKEVKKRKRNAVATESSKTSKSKKKRVSFSENVEVFPLPEHLKFRKLNSEGELVQGKRYTPEEDAKIMQAIDDYIVEHGLAVDGVDKDLDENWKKARNMVMNCKEHPELKGCWKDISSAIPCRTAESIYQRAHLIFERAEERKWTKEEIDMILSFHEKHGPKWRELGDFLGKSRKHVKDAFRRNKLSGEKKGPWSQEEYQKLFELVNHDICIKALQEKKVKHGMLRDNIAWGAISESIGTRASPTCCNKWYYQICSSMVLEGKWSDTDDYKLVDALYNRDACCIEDVEWDRLLEHRSGDLCQKRWAEMARSLGQYRLKPFLEQVEVLHQRYDRDLIEAREIYEKKDPIDI